jgi:hypothetical protein
MAETVAEVLRQNAGQTLRDMGSRFVEDSE